MYAALKTLKKFWNRSMFQKIDIRLGGPICKCKRKDLAWGIAIVEGRATILITCNQCQQQLRVAPAEFKAAILLDKPYPETAPTEPAIIKDGTLIDASKRFLR